MLLGDRFEAFIKASPVSVLVRGTLERLLHAEAVEGVFRDHAVAQYTRKITFARCIQVMDAVVFKTEPSVGAWYQQHGDQLGATRQSLYDKLGGIEPAVSAALVRRTGKELAACIRGMKRAPKPPLPGYRVRVLDGSHLAGTEHRLIGLRDSRSAALPGQALVLYDPQYDLIVDVIPCEDAYTQERALLDQALKLVARNDCLLADRNFCTAGFWFGLHRRGAYGVIREHAGLAWAPDGDARDIGADSRGRRLREQVVRLTDPASGEVLRLRRITIPLAKPNDKGETELHVLTNLPETVAGTVVADLYARRWTIETAFQRLAQDLRSEVDTLAYPKAALFGFCLGCVAYSAVSLVKAVMRATLGGKFVDEELSTYYLTLEVAQVSRGMGIAIPDEAWAVFRQMTRAEFVGTAMALASGIQASRYRKHKRGPKKQQPKKTSGKHRPHVSTARVLAGRT